MQRENKTPADVGAPYYVQLLGGGEPEKLNYRAWRRKQWFHWRKMSKSGGCFLLLDNYLGSLLHPPMTRAFTQLCQLAILSLSVQ